MKMEDNTYYIVDTGKGINSIGNVLIHDTEMSASYDQDVEESIFIASGRLIAILYGINHNEDINQLTRYGEFYKIIKIEEIKEESKYYIVKMNAEYITKRKSKIINKKIKIYKAYENINEFVNGIRNI